MDLRLARIFAANVSPPPLTFLCISLFPSPTISLFPVPYSLLSSSHCHHSLFPPSSFPFSLFPFPLFPSFPLPTVPSHLPPLTPIPPRPLDSSTSQVRNPSIPSIHRTHLPSISLSHDHPTPQPGRMEIESQEGQRLTTRRGEYCLPGRGVEVDRLERRRLTARWDGDCL